MFNVALLLACLAAWRLGGAPERIVALLFVSASAGTFLLPFDRGSFHHVEWGEFTIDAGLLALLTAVALTADRFWPMWLAAMQLVTVAVHGVRAYQPELLALTYSLVVSKFGYGALAILAIGVVRHRGRLMRGGVEHDWTFQRRRVGLVHGSAADAAGDRG